MNFILGLCISCLFCFSLTSCKPLESRSMEKLNEHLRTLSKDEYQLLLLLALAAASSGKTVFNTPYTLSEDCIRTSKVIMQLYYKPTTFPNTLSYLDESISKVRKHRENSTFDNLVSMSCDELSKQGKEDLSKILRVDFDEQKKAVEIPRPSKPFLVDISSIENFTDVALLLDDTEVIKFIIMTDLYKIGIISLLTENQEDRCGILLTIVAMYNRKVHPATMDDVFTKTLNNFANNMVTRGVSVKNETDIDNITGKFLKIVDQDFIRTESLKDEYSKLRILAGGKNETI